MRTNIFVLILISFALFPLAAGENLHSNPQQLLIPAPASLVKGEGSLVFDSSVDATRTVGGILEFVDDSAITDPEGYRLTVAADSVQIAYSSDAGRAYGLTSWNQIVDAAAKEQSSADRLEIPCMTIEDAPRFKWRGLMLDESRHFFGVEEVKRLLDWMALLKLNRFHWHLTDTPGWRIEIKKYPKLTTVGGVGNHSDAEAPAAFYTQDQIREIVAYAQERHIIVIPEIDMPGHAAAAARAYPEISGGGNAKYPDFTFNPGSEVAYGFLEDVLKEVVELFPSPWVHFGGDEVHFANDQWDDLPEVKALMKREKLRDREAVEYYFNRRMASFINEELGKIVVGWGEVSVAGLDNDPEKTLLMWWRHDQKRAMKKMLTNGYRIVMTPRIPCYFDFVQHASHRDGRRWGGYSRLDLVYNFPDEPALKIPSRRWSQVEGIQASIWTETIHTPQRLQFMTFPRITALAEAAWTPEAAKNYDHYLSRLPYWMKRFEAEGISYFNPLDPRSTKEVKAP